MRNRYRARGDAQLRGERGGGRGTCQNECGCTQLDATPLDRLSRERPWPNTHALVRESLPSRR